MTSILETPRLLLREMELSDFSDLCRILQDPVAMTAYEHAFSDDEVWDWLNRQRERYRRDGFGLWAMVLKETGAFIGQAGLTLQNAGDRTVIEVGYLLRRDCWHCGYATEAAIACKQYAFETLGCRQVFSIIRDSNLASQRVAERNGMTVVGRIVKHYYGMDMPHLLFCADALGEEEQAT